MSAPWRPGAARRQDFRAQIRKYAYHESVDTLQRGCMEWQAWAKLLDRVAVSRAGGLDLADGLGWIVRGLDPNILQVQFLRRNASGRSLTAWGPVRHRNLPQSLPLGLDTHPAPCSASRLSRNAGSSRRSWRRSAPSLGAGPAAGGPHGRARSAAQLYLLAGASNGGGFVVPASALCSTSSGHWCWQLFGACLWMWLAPLNGRNQRSAGEATARAGTPR